ncbi:hypothetical protein LJC49_00500 [Ruminococcaceae bacterium OttesenSCG-928-I18]|nr:hypothetical protein [Ruminococcaceae bacterium OttesenSCG-928-I18]
MTDLRVFLAFCALVVLALFYMERGVRGSLAPLCAVCSAGLFFALLGCAGLLELAGWAFYLFCLLAAGWLLYRWGYRKKPLPAPGFGLWFFVGAGLLMLLVLAVRRPMFVTWDEFSTWGTAAKLMKLNDGLYTTAEVGWVWTATQPPFLMCLGYLVQFFGQGFVEWQHYAAVDLLLLAVIGALFSPLRKQDWPLAVPLALIGFLTPFVFTLYIEPLKVAPPWLDSLADVPMGFLFGGALAAWFAGQGRGVRRLLPVCLALAALTLTKDTALALGLVAAALVCVDSLVAKREEGRDLAKHVGLSLGRFGVLLACVAGPFLLWAGHLSAAAGVNRFELGGVRNAGMAEMFLLFFRELFSSEKSEHFLLVLQGMPERYLTSRSTMLGSGALATAVILLLVALAALLTKEAAQRRRCIGFGVFSALGFLPYFLLITLTYIYVFRPEQAFESFERYLYPYYIGWFLASVLLLALSARASRFVVEGKAALWGLSLLLTLRCWLILPPVYTAVAFDPSEFDERRRFEQRVNELTAHLDPEGRTFVISTDDTGLKWFTYCYAFLPWQVDYSYGGGPFEIKELQEDGSRLVTPVDAEAWEEHLLETGCTTVFIDKADEAFAQEYEALFEDGMRAYFDEETVLYDVVVQNGQVQLVSADILL